MAIAQELATIDFAKSLTTEEIPAKLRCTSCNKLAFDAVKLPCCDQSICEDCKLTLPESCPICMHSPLDASACKVNKSLRLTIKAFLRAEEKKRSKAALQAPPVVAVADNTDATPNITPDTVAELTVTSELIDTDPPATPVDGVASGNVNVPLVSGQTARVRPLLSVIQHDEATADVVDQIQSLPTSGEKNDAMAQVLDVARENEETNDHDLENDERTHEGTTPAQEGEASLDQSRDAGQPMNSAMPMSMPNGFTGFPMMGMGMGMPNMFGFNGMNMNDMSSMNMGMGMNMNMNGFGGWNQGGMNGNFYGNGGGFDQFGNQMMNHQFPNQNYSNNRFRGQGAYRGYGRGRGGYQGRGNHHQQGQQWSSNWHNRGSVAQGQWQNEHPNHMQGDASSGEQHHEHKEEMDVSNQDSGPQHRSDGDVTNSEEIDNSHEAMAVGQQDNEQDMQDAHGPTNGQPGPNNGAANNFGGPHTASPIVPIAPPINAPTGPRAMRQGFANGRAASHTQRAPSIAQSEHDARRPSGPSADIENERRGSRRDRSRESRPSRRSRSRSQDSDEVKRSHKKRHRHDGTEDGTKPRRSRRTSHGRDSRSRSRSRDRDQDRHRSRRHRSRDHSHEHSRERPRTSRSTRDNSAEARRHKYRSRSRSRSRHRDRDDDHHHKSRSGRRRDKEHDSHRADKDVRGEREARDKRETAEEVGQSSSQREADQKRSRRPHPSADDDLSKSIEAFRRKRSQGERKERIRQTVPTPADDDIGFKIKGSREAAARTATDDVAFAPPTGPRRDRTSAVNGDARAGGDHDSAKVVQTESADPYALEREARQRERMLREQKRRESATSGKRSRDDDETFAPPSGPRADGRRSSGHEDSRKRRRESREDHRR